MRSYPVKPEFARGVRTATLHVRSKKMGRQRSEWKSIRISLLINLIALLLESFRLNKPKTHLHAHPDVAHEFLSERLLPPLRGRVRQNRTPPAPLISSALIPSDGDLLSAK